MTTSEPTCPNLHPVAVGSSFCPTCGLPTIGGAAPSAWAPPAGNTWVGHRHPLRWILGGIGVLILVIVIAVAASGGKKSANAMSSSTTGAGTGRSAASAAAPLETSPEVPTPTPSPIETTETLGIGQPAQLTENGTPRVDIVITKVSQHASYPGPFSADTPDVAGDVFIQAFVTYTAHSSGVTYGGLGFDFFVDNSAQNNNPFVVNGPQPELVAGTLPAGHKVSGWIVAEVLATGKVVMSYNANTYPDGTPIFQVVIRSK